MRFAASSAAIVGASLFNQSHFQSMSYDYVVAADAGYSSLKRIDVTPHCIVGDFDSLGYVPKGAHVLQFPQEKDDSDLELASKVAGTSGAHIFVYYGCLAGRFDQTLAAVAVMRAWSKASKRVFGIGDSFCISIVDAAHPLVFKQFPPKNLESGFDETSDYGRYISVFACGDYADGVCEHGLKYSLDHDRLQSDISRGLSNEFCGAPAMISVEKGQLIVVFPLTAWKYIDGLFA